MNNTTYILLYVVNEKTITICRSTNYAFVKRKKDVYDKELQATGQIKKLRKA